MAINMPAETVETVEKVKEVETVETCCAPGVSPLDADRAAALAVRLGALADPVRLQILSMIAAAPVGEVCACDFVGPIGKSQPTISHHLKVLAAAELVQTERRGRWIWYRLSPDAIAHVTAALTDALTVTSTSTSASTATAAPATAPR